MKSIYIEALILLVKSLCAFSTSLCLQKTYVIHNMHYTRAHTYTYTHAYKNIFHQVRSVSSFIIISRLYLISTEKALKRVRVIQRRHHFC